MRKTDLKVKMQKHFVTFLSPGTFVFEETRLPIDSWDVPQAIEMSKSITERYGAKPFGFRFSTQSRGPDDLDSKESARSKMYYLGGRILTLEDVKREMPGEDILISNMENNGYSKVLVNTNSWRTIVPFNEGDVLLA